MRADNCTVDTTESSEKSPSVSTESKSPSVSTASKVPAGTTKGPSPVSVKRTILEGSAKFFKSASGVNTFRKDDGTMVVELEFSEEEFQHLVKHFTTRPTTTLDATRRMTASDTTNTTINTTRTRKQLG